MPTSPYLMHINSRPKLVSDEVWQEWYIKEHLPDLVNHGCAVRATFHTEVLSGPTVIDGPSESNPRKYLALYQSDIPECLDTDNYRKGVRKTSELFEKASGIAQDMPNGEFDGRYYKLYETYDPNKLGDGMFISRFPRLPDLRFCFLFFFSFFSFFLSLFLTHHTVTSPYIMTVEMNAKDDADFHKWYKDEHLEMLAAIPGYRRSSRYVFHGSPLMITKPAKFLAIHELENLDGLTSPEAKAANETEWTVRMIRESDPFVLRLWKMVTREGSWVGEA
jgi:hypothetical protein